MMHFQYFTSLAGTSDQPFRDPLKLEYMFYYKGGSEHLQDQEKFKSHLRYGIILHVTPYTDSTAVLGTRLNKRYAISFPNG